MIAFTDPLFLLLAVLIWVGGVGWTYGITRLLIRRTAPITVRSKTNDIAETAFEINAVLGLFLWVVVAPFLLGVGQVAITLEGYVSTVVGALIAMFGVGFAFEAEHVEIPDLEAKEDPERYPW